MRNFKRTIAVFVILLALLLPACSCHSEVDWHGTYCSVMCEITEDGDIVQSCIQECMKQQ